MRRSIYVLSFDVIRDYPDVVRQEQPLKSPTVDLSNSILSIPVAVIRQLRELSREKTDQGRSARLTLNYLDSSRVSERIEDKTLCLPSLELSPEADGYSPMNAVLRAENALRDEFIVEVEAESAYRDQHWNGGGIHPIVLTNEPDLSLELKALGIKTQRFSYDRPHFTGRRVVTIPLTMLRDFLNFGRIEIDDWNQENRDAEPLRANEFIEFQLSEESDADAHEAQKLWEELERSNYKFRNIGRFDAGENAIVPLRHAYDAPVVPKNAGQAMYLEALMSPEISAVICSGPAGTGKTYFATLAGYHLTKNGKYIGLSVVPCTPIDTIGYLPGDLSEKMDPRIRPLKNALRNYFIEADPELAKRLAHLEQFGATDRAKNGQATDDMNAPNGSKSLKAKLEERVDLVYSNWFGAPIPVEHARGRDFSHEFVIYDEFEDQSIREANTLIKRLGTGGKIVITGDVNQIHAEHLSRANNGLSYAISLLAGSPMVACIEFTEDEVLRHPLVKYAIAREKKLGLAL